MTKEQVNKAIILSREIDSLELSKNDLENQLYKGESYPLNIVLQRLNNKELNEKIKMELIAHVEKTLIQKEELLSSL